MEDEDRTFELLVERVGVCLNDGDGKEWSLDLISLIDNFMRCWHILELTF